MIVEDGTGGIESAVQHGADEGGAPAAPATGGGGGVYTQNTDLVRVSATLRPDFQTRVFPRSP